MSPLQSTTPHQPYITLHLPLADLAALADRPLREILLGGSTAPTADKVEAETEEALEEAPRPNSGALVDLTPNQFSEFYRPIDPLYQQGVQLLASKGGLVAWDEFAAIGITNPGHLKSRLSLRARKVLGSKVRVQFAAYVERTQPDGTRKWFLRVSDKTLASMKAYFGTK